MSTPYTPYSTKGDAILYQWRDSKISHRDGQIYFALNAVAETEFELFVQYEDRDTKVRELLASPLESLQTALQKLFPGAVSLVVGQEISRASGMPIRFVRIITLKSLHPIDS